MNQILTFLASHSCLGRGLLTPIKLSSFGKAGKEKTVGKNDYVFKMYFSTLHYIFIIKKKTLTISTAINICLIHTSCMTASTKDKEEKEGLIVDENKTKHKSRGKLDFNINHLFEK